MIGPILVGLASLLAFVVINLGGTTSTATQAATQLRSGGRMPLVGLGTWQVNGLEVQEMVSEAVRAGYRAIDTATLYGNEREIGAALELLYADGVVAREDLFLTSKLPNNAHEPEYVSQVLGESLRALRTDTLDLWLMHWPVALRRDSDHTRGLTPEDFLDDRVSLADTWRAMHAEQQAGRVKAIGVSNLGPRRLEQLIRDTGIVPDVNQVEGHPYLAQRELLEVCRRHGVHVTAYSSLGSSGRPDRVRSDDDPHLLSEPAVLDVAERVGRDAGQVLLRWALQRGTSVIPKSVKPHRIRSNAQLFDFELDAADMAALDALDRGHRFIAGAVFYNGRTAEEFWA